MSEPDARIILTGDFYAIAIKKLSFLEPIGLHEVIDDNESTHKGGNHLEQIWTNLKI